MEWLVSLDYTYWLEFWIPYFGQFWEQMLNYPVGHLLRIDARLSKDHAPKHLKHTHWRDRLCRFLMASPLFRCNPIPNTSFGGPRRHVTSQKPHQSNGCSRLDHRTLAHDSSVVYCHTLGQWKTNEQSYGQVCNLLGSQLIFDTKKENGNLWIWVVWI